MNSQGLIRLQGSSWLIPGPTNLGIIEKDGEVILIDSGNDKESGRKINKLLKEKAWTLKTIINTHSNADHIGGNDYLQRLTHCEILAPEIETAFIEHPELEGSLLWGGYPVKEMRTKFFQAKPSTVTHKMGRDAKDVTGYGLEFIGLPGHFFDMIGIRTADNVLFLGDCMFGADILGKYHIPFVYDVAAYKETLMKIRTLEADYFVLSHGDVVTDIMEVADINEQIVVKLESFLRQILMSKLNYDDILQKVCDHFHITLDFGQYALVGSTLRSFLSYLYNDSRIDYFFEGNRMYWIARD